ncbi:MAG: plasmid pRiA4b ORF-3 family protein, partial [Bacteroidaceae bacterium]|nr:plasmid pRiA4b ORF-3 family protein [Bacteroidaceae bacterium]
MRLKLKVTLKRVERPKVRREITVPEDYTFDQLHIAIQLAFGWTNSHLYQFSDAEIYDKTNPYNES